MKTKHKDQHSSWRKLLLAWLDVELEFYFIIDPLFAYCGAARARCSFRHDGRTQAGLTEKFSAAAVGFPAPV